MAVFDVARSYLKKSEVRIEPWTFENYITTQARKIGPPITIRKRQSTFPNRGDLNFMEFILLCTH